MHSLEPQLAGKITGMLLEMSEGEVLHMLEDQAACRSKVGGPNTPCMPVVEGSWRWLCMKACTTANQRDASRVPAPFRARASPAAVDTWSSSSWTPVACSSCHLAQLKVETRDRKSVLHAEHPWLWRLA